MKKHNSIKIILAAGIILGAAGTLSASQKSESIESSAKKTYVFMTYLKSDTITIQAINDTAITLTGTVSEWSHRSLAEETVAGLLPGVRHIHNKLVVKSGQPAENSDLWISMKVKTMLMFHRNVSGLKTEVVTNAGVVTLRGPASSEAQKELTTEYAKDVDGVTSVKNDMTVEKAGKTAVDKVGEYVDDASITAQIKVALLFHRSTSIVKTKVTTKDGAVTVSGVAKNSAERDLVGKLVNDINGVKSLKNEMTIG